MKKIIDNFRIPNIVYVLLLGFIFRLVISGFGTLQLDHGTFVAWSYNLAQNGFKNFYSSWSDYFPGYLYVLWLLGKASLLNLIPQTLLYKLPAIFFDLGTTYLIYLIVSKFKSKKVGLVSSLIYIFNPAIFGNSALWGQVDSVSSFFALLAIYLIDTNYLLSAVSLSVGMLIKPQPIFIAPVILLMLIKNKTKIIDYLKYGVLSLFVFLAGFLPFWNGGNFFNFVIQRITVSLNQYPYLSVNAFSFWGLFGMWKPDNVGRWIGAAVVLLLTLFIFIKKYKNYEKNQSPYLFAASLFAITFFFLTRMHERHMLPIFAPLLIAAAFDKILLIPYLGLSIVYVSNLIYSYKWINESNVISFNPFYPITLGLVSLFVIFLHIFYKNKLTIFASNVVKFFNKGRVKRIFKFSSENNSFANRYKM